MYSISVLSIYCKNVVYNVDISSIKLLGQMANKTKELKLASPLMALEACLLQGNPLYIIYSCEQIEFPIKYYFGGVMDDPMLFAF